MQLKAPRIFLLDIVRITAAAVILFFHFWQFTYYKDIIHFSNDESIQFLLVEFFSFFGPYFGLLIVAISFFLMGIIESQKGLFRLFVLFIGVVILQVIYAEDPTNPMTWSWDVYSFLIGSLIWIWILPEFKVIRIPTILLSLIALAMPWSFYQNWAASFDPEIASFLFGVGEMKFSGWSFLPWIAVPSLFHSLGVLLRERWQNQSSNLEISWFELFIWFIFFLAIFSQYNSYYPMPVGPGFASFVFQNKPDLLWSHFAVFSFLMRLAIDPRFNNWLAQKKWVQWISSTMWARRFGLTYLMQFYFIPFGWTNEYFWNQHPRLFDLLWIGALIGCELLARLIDFAHRKQFEFLKGLIVRPRKSG
jgi:hypothetical protein